MLDVPLAALSTRLAIDRAYKALTAADNPPTALSELRDRLVTERAWRLHERLN